ncbi:CsbA family protein [Paenisporosarcina sp. TG20]|uniref:CsbA family protein n=1 Tax=Paenisporosarcina sp. TG20 TaxID=1211706 RepID=UPI00030279B5|nr:CsbA family protein [Paenisporosarcina sp. TG20]
MESMATKIIFALFIPGLLVILFTRITFSHIVALILTVALITASIYAGYTHTWQLYIIDAISLTIGFWYATRMMKRGKG